MADLFEVLPEFDIKPFTHLVHSLEKNNITVADLLSLDPTEIARRCPLPLIDVKRLVNDVIKQLQRGLRIDTYLENENEENDRSNAPLSLSQNVWLEDVGFLRSLDPTIDEILGGGFLPGHITEIVGESAAGKTQFVLGLLLSIQLPRPQGFGKGAIYLSTEAPLNTNRLNQMLESHPAFENLSSDELPSLDNVHTMTTNDLEAQEHTLQYQLPIAVKRFNIGLVVVDSVAANFRAEHETKTAIGLANRATDLTKLGSLLRRIAIENRIAVVVTNQVSDRFEDNPMKLTQERLYSSSPALSSSPMQPKSVIQSVDMVKRKEILTLDHQQRFFTGWGNGVHSRYEEMKTPTLGLAWANQISARVVLKMENDHHKPQDSLSNDWTNRKRRRFMSLVFAPWAEPTVDPIEYEITTHGIVTISKSNQEEDSTGMNQPIGENSHGDLLHSDLWVYEDEEFP